MPASAAAAQLRVTLEGPFFSHQPGKTLYQNIGEMLDRLGEELEHTVRSEFEAHEGAMPYWTGWSRDHVQGYRTSPKTGKHWSTWVAVASVTTGMSAKDAIRTKAAAASIEARWHPYRNTKGAVYGSRAVISADLAKGLE